MRLENCWFSTHPATDGPPHHNICRCHPTTHQLTRRPEGDSCSVSFVSILHKLSTKHHLLQSDTNLQQAGEQVAWNVETRGVPKRRGKICENIPNRNKGNGLKMDEPKSLSNYQGNLKQCRNLQVHTTSGPKLIPEWIKIREGFQSSEGQGAAGPSHETVLTTICSPPFWLILNLFVSS